VKRTPVTFVSLVLLLSLLGCATIRPISTTENVNHIYKKNYELGAEKSAYVGEEIIKVMDYYIISRQLNKVRANDDFTVSVFGSGSYHVSKGETFSILGVTEQSDGLQYVIMFPGMIYIKFCINTDGTISDRLIGQFNQKLVYSPSIVPRNASLSVVSVEEIDASKGYINYELVFTGISENNINILYREYTKEGMAREAFYQNLTYPIDSKSIRFKNILLSVMGVSSEQIDYRVMRDSLREGIK
jgi:hypothetical protein